MKKNYYKKVEELRDENCSPNLIPEQEAAKYCSVSLAFLRRRRSEGNRTGIVPGPPFVKLGKAVRYRLSDLDEWINENIQGVA